jgi:8-hydroxy-5-deazaflavin:NADPH oxidoreductase
MTSGPHNVAIIGAGQVGSHLARGLAAAGHTVTVGVRDATTDRAVALADAGLALASPEDAAAGAEVVVLAVPAPSLGEVVPSLGDLDSKVVVDATNAVGTPLPDGFDTLAAYVSSLARGAAVVKAFNTIGAEHMESATVAGTPAFLPIAGHDAGRPVVVDLATSLGFDVADLGGPDCVQMVEDAARLWIHLAFRGGWGRDFAFGVLRPAADPGGRSAT